MKNTIKILVVVTIILLTSCSKDDGAETPTPQDPKLIELLKDAEISLLYDGDAKDSKGTIADGVVEGATLTTDRKGQSNKAYSFSDDDYIRHKIRLTTKSKFSISLWVKVSSITSTDVDRYSKNTVLNSQMTGLGLYGSNNKTYLRSLSPSNTVDSHLKSQVFSVNKWHHYLCEYSGNSFKVYLDSKLMVNTPLSPRQIREVYDHFVLGATHSPDYGDPYFHYFNGAIDDIHIFNKVLTEDEIKLLANDK